MDEISCINLFNQRIIFQKESETKLWNVRTIAIFQILTNPDWNQADPDKNPSKFKNQQKYVYSSTRK